MTSPTTPPTRSERSAHPTPPARKRSKTQPSPLAPSNQVAKVAQAENGTEAKPRAGGRRFRGAPVVQPQGEADKETRKGGGAGAASSHPTSRGLSSAPAADTADPEEVAASAEPAGLSDPTALMDSEYESDESGEDLRKADTGTRIRTIRARLGLGKPLVPKTVHLPLASLVVIDEPGLHHRDKDFIVSLGLVGMLHAPAVVPIPATDTYQVVFGRRRVLNARHLEPAPETIECHVYEQIPSTERALMILHENGRRDPAWKTESAALAELVDAHVGLTDEEIAIALSIPLSTARQRLKIARLPLAIRDQALHSPMTLTVARQILRLTPAACAALVEQAEAGETITADLVNQALRGQIGSGMGVVRQALADSWQPWEVAATWGEAQAAQAQQAQQAQAASGHQHQSQTYSDEERSSREGTPSAAPSLPMGRPPTRQTGAAGAAGAAEVAVTEHIGQNLLSDNANDDLVDAADPWDPDVVEQLLLALHRLSRRLEMIPGTARAGMLAQALSQELEILQRTRVHVHDAQAASSNTASALHSEE